MPSDPAFFDYLIRTTTVGAAVSVCPRRVVHAGTMIQIIKTFLTRVKNPKKKYSVPTRKNKKRKKIVSNVSPHKTEFIVGGQCYGVHAFIVRTRSRALDLVQTNIRERTKLGFFLSSGKTPLRHY